MPEPYNPDTFAEARAHGTAVEAVAQLLGALGVDEGEHTAATPARVAKAWAEMLSGYREDPADHLARTFPAPDDPGLVMVAGIALTSTCAHHMLPFTGRCTVAYRPSPGQRIVGLSKLARVVHGYARRMQVQEQIGAQVLDAIVAKLNPSGAMVLITASHDCMRLRGVREPDSVTTTQAHHGLLTDSERALIHAEHARAR
ncbi:GTP cyclohydrolase I [Gordonia sp. TBRC 11910]|uniref:GTP cyclohydrolase 1 n=2 Tax=Gordonia asplenii TaxID=2725283 RepID=A0A848KS51_9ACTN|nr:GTP cyclohydrolase I [Gordonia asplenii]